MHHRRTLGRQGLKLGASGLALAGLAWAGPAAWAQGPAPASPAPEASPVAPSIPMLVAQGLEPLAQRLQGGLAAFNRGDFQAYVSDLAPRVRYDGVEVGRDSFVEVNQELRQSFPTLSAKLEALSVKPGGSGEAYATAKVAFDGAATNYEGSGLRATYREVGQITTRYRQSGGQWVGEAMQVGWNDSFIDVGEGFGVLGFTTLPTMVGAGQPYRFRLFAGRAPERGIDVRFAYAVVPLARVLAKDGAAAVAKELRYVGMPANGIDEMRRAPAEKGPHVHLLVANQVLVLGAESALVGQKVYTRFVRVE